MSLNESIVEAAGPEWFEALGYALGRRQYPAPDRRKDGQGDLGHEN